MRIWTILPIVLATASGSSRAAVADVEIHHFAFTPEEISLVVGDRARWNNLDSMLHSVTSQTGPGTLIPSGVFDSGLLEQGDTFEFTFTSPGTFHYFCLPHGSSMQGVVRVFCTADFDRSEFVDIEDFTAFVGAFLGGSDAADVDRSGFVDTDDYDCFVRAYEAGC